MNRSESIAFVLCIHLSMFHVVSPALLFPNLTLMVAWWAEVCPTPAVGWVLKRFWWIAGDLSFCPEPLICFLVELRHVFSSQPLSFAVKVQDLAQQCEEALGVGTELAAG